ncbi:ATP-binding protein [Actomonas aquatica]|uniref:histidine kinase n=1 Tax=Actomonas aquatica TaxID=2866162 RepID=A0ABZ1CEI1_9BACT|nr:ATP-binding protein [Opitutus sp. WL0086]WRQ89959.1 ATP-binding protein [Opitutus sp. WL0086]
MTLPPSNTTVDLTNCDREPIHIPGSVQAHAVLLCLSEPDWVVEQVSVNIATVLPDATPATVLGQALSTLLSSAQIETWQQELAHEPLDQSPLYLSPLPARDGGPEFEALMHRHDGVLILELERWLSADALESAPSLHRFQRTLNSLAEAETLTAFSQRAADAVRSFIGFDRVMVYRFADDDSGHVIAESRRQDLDTYLGLHYPASDIPKQARDLFRRSPVRLNPDIYYQPVPLEPTQHPRTGRPLDMSHCVTRSMSPIHVEYLSNMGVAASMSLSIVVDGRLWGLFACHHYQPRYVSQGARIACEFLARTLSLQTANKERADYAHYERRLIEAREHLVTALDEDHDLPDTLQSAAPRFGQVECAGSALLLAGEVHPLGDCPSDDAVLALGRWLAEHHNTSVSATVSAADWDADLAAQLAPLSGVLATRLCRDPVAYLFWFRLPEVQKVNWAGNPTKPVEPGPHGDRLTPRKSFDLWQEEVRDRSLPWLLVERDAARSLRHVVLEGMARQTERLVRLQVELEQRNQDLESFSYIASHDLKEPLRGLRNYARYLAEDHATEFTADANQKVDTIRRLGDRMELLIDALLHYSRVGRAEPCAESIDLNITLEHVREQLSARLEESPIELRVPRPLPTVSGDPVLLAEIYANLISNAIKYNDKDAPWVELGWREPATPGQPLQFYVRDNGVGIATEDQPAVFRIFKRLYARDEFGGGAGAGLTIVRAILTRLGGHIWLDSTPGEGSTFTFTLSAPSTSVPS